MVLLPGRQTFFCQEGQTYWSGKGISLHINMAASLAFIEHFCKKWLAYPSTPDIFFLWPWPFFLRVFCKKITSALSDFDWDIAFFLGSLTPFMFRVQNVSSILFFIKCFMHWNGNWVWLASPYSVLNPCTSKKTLDHVGKKFQIVHRFTWSTNDNNIDTTSEGLNHSSINCLIPEAVPLQFYKKGKKINK